MKRILVTLSALLPLTVFAQDDDASARMRDAELRLEQAAQEIAELSAELAGDSIKHVIKTVRHSGEGRAMLGITIGRIAIARDDGSVEKSRSDPAGVVVNGVTPGGPAEEAGLQSGDVILALNGTALAGTGVSPLKRLTALLDDVTPGETVNVLYRRGDAEQTVQVVTREFSPLSFALAGPGQDFEFHVDGEQLGEMADLMDHFPAFARLGRHRAWRGLELVPLTPKLGSYFGTESGLLVVGVPDGDAFALEEGDVILSIAGATPDSAPEAMRLLRFYEPGEEVVMEVRRKNRDRTIRLAIPE